MIYYNYILFTGYIGPRIPFNEMVNFIFFKFSRVPAPPRENLKKKLKLTISLPQVPLGALVGHFMSNIYTCPTYIHVQHIYMSDIYTCPTYIDYIQYTYMSKKHSIVQKMDL